MLGEMVIGVLAFMISFRWWLIRCVLDESILTESFSCMQSMIVAYKLIISCKL